MQRQRRAQEEREAFWSQRVNFKDSPRSPDFWLIPRLRNTERQGSNTHSQKHGDGEGNTGPSVDEKQLSAQKSRQKNNRREETRKGRTGREEG